MVEVADYTEFYRSLGDAGSRVPRPSTPIVSVSNSLPVTAGVVYPQPAQTGPWTGEKYYGGFGPSINYYADYWTLRERSSQLFRENLYCKGLIRRIVTNLINTGVTVESTPNESVLGFAEDSLIDWSEQVESFWEIWAENPDLCDYRRRDTFWELQRVAKMEALIGGDVLIVIHIDRVTGLPRIQVICGNLVQSPLDYTPPDGFRVVDGVELDAANRQVAYWVVTGADGTGKPTRIPAVGPRSKRRVAQLVYGTEKRYNEVRGEPMLSIMLQHAKELDRSRDAVLRKATLNNILAMVIEKDQPSVGTRGMSFGATKRSVASVEDSEGRPRKFNITQHVPGVYIEELAVGERIKTHQSTANDVDWGAFEKSILEAFAWANEVPPSAMRLLFSANYSASAAETNEFRMFLNRDRSRDADQFYKLVYKELFISAVLTGKIEAPGFLEAWRDPRQYDKLGAWILTDWSGAVKPMVDPVKQATGYKMLVANGWCTHAKAARDLTGTKFSKNVRRLRSENQALADALQSLRDVGMDASDPSDSVATALAVINGYKGDDE